MDMGMESPLSKKRMLANAIGNTLELGSDVGEIAFEIPQVTNGFLVFIQVLGHICVVIGQVLVQVAQVAWVILEPVLKVVVAILSCLK